MENRHLFLITLVILLVLPLINAETTTLGTFKQNSCIKLIQTCSDCTYVNISSVLYPNGQAAIGQVAMIKAGTEYSYNYCLTSQNGEYVVNGFADPDGEVTVWSYNLVVNSDGEYNSIMAYVLILAILTGLIILGFSIADGWFVVLGGLGFIIFGLYTYVNGIAGVSDDFLVLAISLITGGVGAYLAINSAMEIINGELTG